MKKQLDDATIANIDYLKKTLRKQVKQVESTKYKLSKADYDKSMNFITVLSDKAFDNLKAEYDVSDWQVRKWKAQIFDTSY